MKLPAIKRMQAMPLGVASLVCGQPKLALQCFNASLTGNWEGTESNRYRFRSPLRLESQDSSLRYGTRDKYINEARALDQTYGVVGDIGEKFANHVVGDCRITWNTGTVEKDRAYAENWERWMNMADAGGRLHFVDLTRLLVKSERRDGDVFAKQVDTSGFGQLQLIEADRCRTTENAYDIETNSNWVGGVLISGGRPAAYRIWDRSKDIPNYFVNPQEISVREMIHFFGSSRIDACRGITSLASAINALRDLKETVRAEVLSAKRNSKLALIVRSAMGGAGAPNVNLFAATDGTTGTTSGEGDKTNVREVNDGMEEWIGTGEEMKAFESARPHQGWFGLMEWLVQEIAVSQKLPVCVVWMLIGRSLAGPEVRFYLGQANRVFGAYRGALERQWIRRVAGWITAKDIKAGRIPYDPNWFKFTPRRPMSITIDLGRESKMGLDEIDACAGTLTDYHAEEGNNFEEATELRAREEKFIDDMAKKYSLDRNLIRRPPQQVAQIAQAEITSAANSQQGQVKP